MTAEQINLLEKHESNIIKSLEQKGITLEFNQDFARLKKILIAASDYDYEYDTFFEPEDLKNVEAGAIFAQKKGETIATYSYRVIDMNDFYDDMKSWVKSTNGDWLFKGHLLGKTVYSSCQWVSTPHRSDKIGRLLDDLKKVHSLRTIKWDTQFSHCREKLHLYHLEFLKYAHSELAFKSHSVPGSGGIDDKKYYMNWITTNEYLELIQP